MKKSRFTWKKNDIRVVDEKDYIEDPELGRIFYSKPEMSKRQKGLAKGTSKDKVDKFNKIRDEASNPSEGD